MIVAQIRMQGRESTQPLRHSMALRSNFHKSFTNDKLDLLRSKNQSHANLLNELETEDYEEVKRRADDLKARLDAVRSQISVVEDTLEKHVEESVNNSIKAITTHAASSIRPRKINAALPTFDWTEDVNSSEMHTSFNWKQPEARQLVHYTSQWGELSKYGDDPCVAFYNGNKSKGTKKGKGSRK